jgi:cyclopropane-fatty-acyl-phospholipid synthase
VKQQIISGAASTLPSIRDGRKEQVQEILSLADVKIDGGREWDITVHDHRFYARVLRHGSLGLGESYVDGWWDCPALDQLFSRILRAELDRKSSWNWRLMLHWIVAAVLNRQTKLRAKSVAQKHYDLGNELYRNMLDARMVYTCGRWEQAVSLDEAQEAKLDFVCRQLGLRQEMSLLDIGCGWGSLAKFAAEKYGSKVVGITISREQAEWAQHSCEGLPVAIRLQDYRDLTGTFDRVASLGMFEHVGHKNYARFFKVVRRVLRPDGLFYLSTIGANRSVRSTDPWIDKYIFPNSHLPSAAQITAAMEGLFVVENWQNWRLDYDRTIVAWFQNFQKHWRSLQARYGERFYRMWKYYLMVSAACFRSRKNQVWQILLARQ